MQPSAEELPAEDLAAEDVSARELPGVVLVVVTWNSADVLPGLLASLAFGMVGLRWRLVVADNDSADGTADLVRTEAPDALSVQTGRNAGYAAAINAALEAVGPLDKGTDAVLVCNPDIRMEPGCGAALVRGLERSGTGITAPVLFDGDGRMIRTLRREPNPLRLLGEMVLGAHRSGRFAALGEQVADPHAYSGPTRADWVAGSLMALSRECVEACGPWDESFFLYSEETEYALRARSRGFATRLAPDAVAVHLEGEAAVSPRLWTLLTVNRVRLYRRTHGAVAVAAFWSALVLREASRALLGRASSRAAVRALVSPARMRAKPGP
ncbi:glycosyltransferase family 2 protein [Catenulispora sp. NF23]|uniref:Glycosyltransferase family 2 protein n=1 Tax=Catenulispora pinistramenti TaxID=2705254 RepID=A0ABS5KVR3_9ACTN|nr:glycosyltransferase family 2 protein [Catenulispora pinistramenti]MBS2537273.1 glycosyltransferase family 2 protein [Catenulispora pinistramenti]MBS2550152.1 glycosyltransferase family 2 protein [Catenulispora pinistramenti]